MLYAKLQSYVGEEFLIKTLPASLSNFPSTRGIRVMKCPNNPLIIGELKLSEELYQFSIIPHTELQIENQVVTKETILNNFSRIYIPCKECRIKHYYTFILPLREPLKYEAQRAAQTQFNRVHDKVLYAKWTQEDKEMLKKLILQFGYGRWNKLQQLKFANRTKQEIKAFANSLLRSIVELLVNYDLGAGIVNLIEENPDDPYIETNQKDWELQNLKQKLISISKRILMLAKIREFIKKFKEHQLKNLGIKDKSQLKWDYLLGFIPSSSFYSQRPSIWWTRKHDSDLIRGVYQYGYTNHLMIKEASDLCFKDLSTSQNYQEFPFPETLNKRVKKLVQIIQKFDGFYDFDNLAQSDDEEEKSWSIAEKQALFNLLCDYGVPIGVDGRQNWQELKDKLILKINKFDKNLNQLEKMVQTIRTRCEQMLMKHKEREFLESDSSELEIEQPPSSIGEIRDEQGDEFQISYQDSQKFSKQTNMLHFIRKNILPQNQALFQQHIQSVEKELFIDIPEYDPKIHDIQIIITLSQTGFNGLQPITLNNINIIMTTEQILNRIEQLCSFFKKIRDQTNIKRKPELKDDQQKKIKPNTNGGLNEIQLPYQVSTSLKLVSLGRIIPSPAYHSEHNLFPVGYKSIRTHASMFTKGKRCQYTCEILEGSDGKPLFKVTSEEDVDNPIIKNSCTGCWVHIYNKINELQEHKKSKVTISGTDRFGLLEANVQRYLEELQNAELCSKYKFKYRNVTQDF
ncbi:unnamed protein product [Paramecium primaurelia]|uniref:Myb-like domain-containing protein n=1 Tax=Paramecium primaurelia TaxID=5886 RepID=A0A8S1MCJ6_PARPR|nr:unnamed protein product [Paramecium primaurelia]